MRWQRRLPGDSDRDDTMKTVKIHEGAQGWEPGFTGLRE